MRLVLTSIVGLWVSFASLPAQTPVPTTPAKPASPTIKEMLEAPIGPTSTMPKDLTNFVPALRPPPTPETRTVEQLQAVLVAYVGRWRGEYIVRTVDGKPVAHFPVEVDYSFEEKDGRQVLKGVTTYTNNGKQVVDSALIWIENGQIVSELSHGEKVEKFAARTRGNTLVWFTRDPDKSLIDYNMTETLSLTGTGGVLSIQGFEAVPNTDPPVLVYETAELKLEKPANFPAAVAPAKSPASPSAQVPTPPKLAAPKPTAKPKEKPPAYINEP